MNMFAKKPVTLSDVSYYHKVTGYAEESDAGKRAVEAGVAITSGQSVSDMTSLVISQKNNQQ